MFAFGQNRHHLPTSQSRKARRGGAASGSSFPAKRANSLPSIDSLENRTLFAVNPAQIDLLVAYLPSARDFAGGSIKLENKVNRVVADLNRALANSRINAAVRLVGVMQTSYTEPAGALLGSSEIVGKLNDPAATEFADVRAAAEQAGADMVHVLDNAITGGVAGLADPTRGTSASYVKHLNSDLFLHEIGHVLGGGHLPGGGAGVRPYAQASNVTVNGTTYGTLINGRGIDYYSNPNVQFRGAPTGTADTDNARAMNEHVPTIAALRMPATADATGPLAGLGAVTAAAGQNAVTFEVTYYDGGGVNTDTLGNGNITVTGPNGLNGAATFIGIRPQPGARPEPVTAATVNYGTITAVYTIATPGAVGNLGDYGFASGASPVKDIAGNAVAGGGLSSASGNTSPTSAQVTPLLPRYGAGETGRAAELGDLSGKSLRITDWVGNYYANNSTDPNLYRFSLSAPGTVTLDTTGAGVRVQIFQNTDDGSFVAAPLSRQLAAGDNYFIKIFPAYTQTSAPTAGQFTLSFTASGAAAGQPAGGTIAGRSFLDLIKDNVAQDVEAGFADQTVTLTGTDANGGAVNLTTKTAGTFGNYAFNNVPPSNGAGYTLSITRPTGNLQNSTAAPTGGLPGTATGTTYTGITVTNGATLAGYNFGFSALPPFRGISGIVWDDSGDRNGLRNQGEPGVAGVTVRLTGNNVAGDPVTSTATTDANGGFQFSVRPSDAAGYTITKVQPIGFVSGAARPGDAGGTASASNDAITGIVISNASGLGYDFGVVKPTTNEPAPIPVPDTTTVPAGQTVTIDILGNDAPTAPVFDLSNGFAGANVAVNGSAAINGTNLKLTDAASQSGSGYYNAEVNVQKFTTSFTFTTTAGAGTADGLTFILQGGRSGARGNGGGDLGYGGIGKSVAVKFDLWQNEGEPSTSTTGLFINGASPIGGATVDLAPSGVDLHSGNPMRVDVVYNGGTLTVTITDTVTNASNTQNYTINIPKTVGSNTAFAGFTGGTGGSFATVNIQSWAYSAATTPVATAAPRLIPPAGGSVVARFALNPQADDGQALFADCTTTPAHAKDFSFNSDGTITYTPEDGFVGTDSFQYLLVDANSGRCSDTHATVTFNVVDVNDAPTLSQELAATASTTTGRAVAIDLREYVTDDHTAADDLRFKVKGLAGGKAKLQADRHTVLFTPGAGFIGESGFTITAIDGAKKRSAPLAFRVKVDASAMPLTAGDTVVKARAGKTVAIDIVRSAVGKKPPVAVTAASIATPPTSGSATIEAGRLLYTPPADARGTSQTMVVLLQDADGNEALATVVVLIR